MFKSIIKKKKKKHDEIVLFEKTKLNIMKIVISKALINSYISQDEFVWVNNVLREYNERMKEENKRKKIKKTMKLLCYILYKNNRNILC